jgi:Histidine kinase-, DNA gyrase B-, and HSP90-like ATPase
MPPKSPATPTIETIGKAHSSISVEISTRFLQHFSEQLYSSPQKAFEELISNGWDAGADRVDVRISPDLKTNPGATMVVLDNGASMNEEGLRQLWHIAFSPKSSKPTEHGRSIIGKFGIGKLATYVLANKLTYICKAKDGKIRRVTMDYAEIDLKVDNSSGDKLIKDVKLQVFDVDESEVELALKSVYGGSEILGIIKQSAASPAPVFDDEYGAMKQILKREASDTWTLVVLSELKDTGKELKLGVLKRMLAAALPFGSEMAITINDAQLVSPKLETPVIEAWTVGPELKIDSLELEAPEEEPPATAKPKPAQKIELKAGEKPVPNIEIPGIGMVTGRVTLFAEPITGGKSEQRGASNGYHINVLGRLINQDSPAFGENSLNHAAWARFRMTVRADGLNNFLTTDRERFKDTIEVRIFKEFLHRAFNKARSAYDSDESSMMPHGGDALVKSLGVVSLNPLRSFVDATLASHAPIPGMIDDSGIGDRVNKRKEWKITTAENIGNALNQVKFEKMTDDSFVKYRISDNSIIVNSDHPFALEHSHTRAEKELMRTFGMVNILSDMYALDIGIKPESLESVRGYRDRIMRFQAMSRRKSGTHIAKLLLQTQHDSSNSKLLEKVVSDALRYLGFHVQDLAKPGEPEGIASAYATPSLQNPTADNPNPPLYSFAFDAKSSKHDVASTGNIKLDGVVEHRTKYKVDYSLVVAPGYSDGAIATRCAQQQVTPITAKDLGKLLEYTVQYGAIPLPVLREMFAKYHPDEVSNWVTGLEGKLTNSRPLTITVFLKALELLKGKIPDALAASTIAYECREKLGAKSVKNGDVVAIASGLSIAVPDLIGVVGDNIIVNASPDRVAEAVKIQLDQLQDTT